MSDKKKNDDIKYPFWRYIFTALAMMSIVLYTYYSNFGHYELSPKQEDWGTFGDFIGGTLNPFLAFLGLIALLTTIRVQSKELEETRIEIKKSTKAQKKQSKSLKLQNFENTFFNMLDLHNKNVDNIILMKLAKEEKLNVGTIYGCYKIKNHKLFKNQRECLLNSNYNFRESVFDRDKAIFDDKDYHGKNAIERLINIFRVYISEKKLRSKFELYEEFHDEYQEIIGHYFGTIYQILKFIKENKIKNKKLYSNLFRSQFSQSELELLFFHGTSNIAKENFAPLLVEFEFFEHLIYTITTENDFRDFYVKYAENNNYSKNKAFGKNLEWTRHYKEPEDIF